MLFDATFNAVFDKLDGMKLSYGYTFTTIDLVNFATGYADDIGNPVLLTNRRLM